MESAQYQDIALNLIDEPEDPSRLSMDPESLGGLADSIAAEGLYQPIGVRGPMTTGRYQLGFGHRRYCAHRLLERVTISCRVWPAPTSLDLMRVSENLNREQLSPIEEAREVAKFLRAGHSQASVARLFRRSTAWVSGRAHLLDLPDELQVAVHQRELTAAVACSLAEVDHADYRRSLVEEAVRTGATENVVRVWVAHYHADKPRIIGNHLTVGEIVEARAAFIVYYTCESCKRDVPYTDTRAWRFCTGCSRDVAAAIEAPAAGAD